MTATATVGASLRVACAPVMLDLARRSSAVMTVGSDGASVFGSIARELPGQYVDVGIAEANLAGVAAGLARCGKKVFITGIGAFLVRRALEQLRVDIFEPGLDVTVIAHGAGLSYGTLGSTHHLIEDLALFQSMPAAAIFTPADLAQAEWALRQAAEIDGPVYVRLATSVGEALSSSSPGGVGSPVLVRAGSDAMVFSHGICVTEALDAAHRLQTERGVSCGVTSIPAIRPLDEEAVAGLAARANAVVIVEDHALSGGLGSRIAILIARSLQRPLVTMGIDERRPPVGTARELLEFYGIDACSIFSAVDSLHHQL